MTSPHPSSDIAGPLLHAHAVVASTGEQVLWAGFSENFALYWRKKKLSAEPSSIGVWAYFRTENREQELTTRYANQIEQGRLITPPTLWMLTPVRLHVAERLTPPEPDDELKNVKGLQRQVKPHPLKPLADVPRAHIARFSVDGRGQRYFLQMELVDGSGFEFVFGADNPAPAERMLALTLGGAE